VVPDQRRRNQLFLDAMHGSNYRHDEVDLGPKPFPLCPAP